MSKPNLVFIFADQWRLNALGYAGTPEVRTPHLDCLAGQSVNLVNAVSGWPVCAPYRASLLTGQYPLTHGVFVNDVPIGSNAVGLGQAFADGGYDTAYIGKWHVDGRGRSAYIPPERRLGFDYWKVLECTHDYQHSFYYAHDSDIKQQWNGYDAMAQTRDAQEYIRQHDSSHPFMLVLSWGPPHDPYPTAPAEYAALYDPQKLTLPPNVPPQMEAQARQWLAGYYAHCTALDQCVGDLVATLDENGLAENTLFIFTSDHGDMLGSQGVHHKQRPWDESIRVPFLLRYPAQFGVSRRDVPVLINSIDIMPTLLGLCDLPIPATVQGRDFSAALEGACDPSGGAALLACFQPFGQYSRQKGGREFRGVRTARYSYVRDLCGPWLLYDNKTDPFQQCNLVNQPEYAAIQRHLEDELNRKLREQHDTFECGEAYIKKWGYQVDETGTVPYIP